MDVREQKQEELVEIGFREKRGIIYASMRTGKTRIGLKILEKIGNQPKTLICYPLNSIKEAWESEMEKMRYINPNITFSSFSSLHKFLDQKWDVILVDECWKLSDRNIESLQRLCGVNSLSNFVLFFTGSFSDGLKNRLYSSLKISLIASYTQEEAIEDGIVGDYQINIITVPLDNQQLIQYKKTKRTEKQQFQAYSGIIKKLEYQEKDTFFLRLARMRIIQNSLSKMETTRKLIRKYKDEKILVFCGLIKIAEQLGIPVEHSKTEDENLLKFQKGEIDKLAVVRMGSSGSTFFGLNKLIINYFSSNPFELQQRIGRALNLEFKGKVADIYILSSNEPTELAWLKKALASFSQEKINYNYKL